LRRRDGIAGALVSALVLTACASYDKDQTESTIVDDLSPQVEEVAGTSIRSADCPDEVDIEKGTRFDCTATLKTGTKVKVLGSVVNDAGEIQVDITPEALGKAAGTS
jgi:major membrane immunogen (membrane-anchored lipoprotein)